MTKYIASPLSLLLVFVLMASTVMAQSEKEGWTLYNQADKLRKEAKSKDDLMRAQEQFEQALRIFQRTNSEKGTAYSWNQMGLINSSQGQYQKALEFYEKALAMYRQGGNLASEGNTLISIGKVYSAWGQYQKALEFYEKALAIQKKVGNAKEEGVTLNNIGLVYASWGQYAKAMEFYEKALAIYRQVGNVAAEGSALICIGRVYRSWGQYAKAMEFYEKALAIYRQVGNVASEGTALHNIGHVYLSWGQYAKALEYYEKALAIYRQVGNVTSEGTALHNIGGVYHSWGQYEKALEYYEKGLGIHRKVGNVREEAVALKDIGGVYRSWGQYQKALEHFQKCLETSRRLGDERTEGWTLGSLGFVYYDLGQYQQALECFQKSLQIARKIGAVGDGAASMNNIALVYSSWGQYQKALEYHEKALEVYRQTGSQSGEGWALNNMADVYQRLGQYERAVQYFAKSLEIKRQTGEANGEASALNNMGKLLASLGKTDEGLANCQKALEIRKRIGVPTKSSHDLIGNLYLDMGDIQQAEAHIVEGGYNSSLGRLCLLKSNFPEAKKYYEKLLREAEQNRNADNLFTAYTGLGKVYESLEEYKKAEDYYDKGIVFTEDIRSSLLPSERKEFFSVKINGFFRSEPGKGLTRVQMKLNQASGSIDSSEVTRARSFADNLFQTSTSGPSGAPRQVLEKEDTLVTRVASLKKELAKTDRDKDQARYEVLTLQVKEAEEDLRSFVEMLWEKHRTYAAVKYPRPVPLKSSALNSDEYVIMFDCFEDGVGVKVVKGKEIVETRYSKFNHSELEKDVRAFREPFERVKLRDFDPTLAQRLYKRLLAPVMTEVPEGSPLIIIPDGILALLPFEALIVLGNATWKQVKGMDYPEGVTYLGDLHPISYYQSITALTLVREATRTKKPGERLLVIADPIFDLKDDRAQSASQNKVSEKDREYYPRLMAAVEENSGGFRFVRLPGTGLLAENLKKLYGPECDDPYIGIKADKAYFLKTLAPKMERYGQIIFATHGLFSDKIPGLLEPFLAFTMVPPGTDGFLTMSDVLGLKMNADLVALTACQTGLGRELSGEGVMSMGRAFQYAGARSVLMSLWSVAEEPSVKLVEDFFKYRKMGKSKLEALRLAREDIRNEGFEHPFFWAAFTLVGEAN